MANAITKEAVQSDLNSIEVGSGIKSCAGVDGKMSAGTKLAGNDATKQPKAAKKGF